MKPIYRIELEIEKARGNNFKKEYIFKNNQNNEKVYFIDFAKQFSNKYRCDIKTSEYVYDTMYDFILQNNQKTVTETTNYIINNLRLKTFEHENEKINNLKKYKFQINK